MRAQTLKTSAPLELFPLTLEDVPILEPSDREVRIQVTACGVCLTDRHIIEGDIPQKQNTIIPGHQIVGRVERVGKDVTRFKCGDRVGVAWLHHTCGQCFYCERKCENLCDFAKFTGYDVPGGYAEYALCDENYLLPILDGLDDVHVAPLLCAGIVGYRSYKLSKIKAGEKLAIFGFGAAAHIMIQVAKHFGCEVFVFTRSENHKRLARELRADWVGGVDDRTPEKCDSAIIFAPEGRLLPKALQEVRKGGHVVFNAIHASKIPSMAYHDLYFEKTIQTVANATREDGLEFLKLAREISIQTEVNVYPLEKANQALLDLKYSKINGSTVLIP